MITHAELTSEVTYDPASGMFCWVDVKYPKKEGRFGFRHMEGYLATKIRGKTYRLHRLAWFYMTGEWPPEQIDHINRVRDDNRWSNLRLASHGQNRSNSQIHKNNKLGLRGVKKTQRGQGYTARITHQGKQIYLGYFATVEAAVEARRKAELELHGAYAATR